jgi:hypothetical protein
MMNFSKKKDSTERIGLLVAASLRVNKLARVPSANCLKDITTKTACEFPTVQYSTSLLVADDGGTRVAL